MTEFDTPDLHKFLEDMFESMYAAKGVGLAAPQIGISRKIAVIDCSNGEDPAEKIVLINPRILRSEGKQEGEEGCLSIPGFREQVRRGKRVTVQRAERQRRELSRRPAKTCWRAPSCTKPIISTASSTSATSARSNAT